MSEYNKKPIDIIVPWVNSNDITWQKTFKEYKDKEIGEKDIVRFRDAGVFNYWFRCVEKNMPWVRYIFLVLASPSQIPNWLNINHPKLKIVYHEQFIPKEELPTFNSSVINCYIPFIEELSDNYILFNDDMFIIHPTKEIDWFINDTPVYFLMHESFRRNGSWSETIINSKTLVQKITSAMCNSNPEHGPISNNKNLNLFLWSKCKNEMFEALHNTKFRNKKNITDWIYFFFTVVLKKFNESKRSIVQYNGSERIITNDKLIFCANDTIDIKNYNLFVNNLKNSLKNFNEKSEFEK